MDEAALRAGEEAEADQVLFEAESWSDAAGGAPLRRGTRRVPWRNLTAARTKTLACTPTLRPPTLKGCCPASEGSLEAGQRRQKVGATPAMSVTSAAAVDGHHSYPVLTWRGRRSLAAENLLRPIVWQVALSELVISGRIRCLL
jgi:hypothetical protein